MISDAVGLELISKIVGYKITKGDFSNTTPNLPQRVAIFAEANTANQASLNTDGVEITTAQQAGELYGFGSPIYHIMRILRPISGSGIGGVPTVVYAQASPGGGTSLARILEITPTGVATASGTHTVVVAGRTGIDGQSYDFSVAVGDTTADITAKISDAINGVLGSPVSAEYTDYECTATTKWTGLTAQGVSISIDTNDLDLGITYAVVETQAGIYTPSVSAALAQFENDWVTLVVNSYGTVTSVMDALEAFNGIPDPSNPTGRFSGIIMKPFVALTGSVADDPTSITDARKTQVTIAICPAPGSDGLAMEAAANVCLLEARTAQDTPHLDIVGRKYPDMPTPTSIGSMATYANRDAFVKKGCSTVELIDGLYQMADFVTTYHPTGELPPQFRYVRNLMLDFNVRFGYYLLEQINVVDHVILSNDQQSNATKTIKPKQWLQIVNKYAEDLAQRALIVDVAFMQSSILVGIGTTNPDRLETFFRYKRSGIARIASTTAEAGFNFGN